MCSKYGRVVQNACKEYMNSVDELVEAISSGNVTKALISASLAGHDVSFIRRNVSDDDARTLLDIDTKIYYLIDEYLEDNWEITRKLR